MTAAIVMNPSSARRGKKGRALERAAAGAPSILFERLDDFSKLNDILRGFAAENIDLLIVSGGDGTVQAIVTAMAQHKIFKKQPRLLLLPHGTTNMTAADIGFKRCEPEAMLQSITREGFVKRATNVKARRSVKIEGLVGMEPQHGFFFGCGAITRAVLKCQTDVHGLGLKGDWATAATLIYSLVKGMAGRDHGDTDAIFQATEMHITADGAVFGPTQNLMFLTTSLNKLILGCRPFWSQTGDGLRTTTIGFPITSILRNTGRVMFGGNQRALDPERYFSRTAQKITLKTDLSVIVDGELFDVDPGGLKISLGPSLEYICG